MFTIWTLETLNKPVYSFYESEIGEWGERLHMPFLWVLISSGKNEEAGLRKPQSPFLNILRLQEYLLVPPTLDHPPNIATKNMYYVDIRFQHI